MRINRLPRALELSCLRAYVASDVANIRRLVWAMREPSACVLQVRDPGINRSMVPCRGGALSTPLALSLSSHTLLAIKMPNRIFLQEVGTRAPHPPDDGTRYCIGDAPETASGLEPDRG